MGAKFCSALVFVKDIKTSRDFYERILGQTVEMDHGACVGYAGGVSIMEADFAGQIMGLSLSGNGHGRFELYFESAELESMQAQFATEKIDFVHRIMEQPWGQRVLRIYDPDRHIVEVGEPMTVVIQRYVKQGLTLEEIAKRTAIPIDIVHHWAELKS